MHEVEDAGIHMMMLTKRLEVPAQKEEIAAGGGQPVGIDIGVEWVARPVAVGEAVAHVIAQFNVARQQIGATVASCIGRQLARNAAIMGLTLLFQYERVDGLVAVAIEVA